ncbi:unnamed protein product [Amoebophrya sp. A25]|nr:unnamed protein product [Amoebophrya sp. A25]|eukprot:GSA25T00021183001.1
MGWIYQMNPFLHQEQSWFLGTSSGSSSSSRKQGPRTSFLIVEKNRSLIPRPPLEDDDDSTASKNHSAVEETECNVHTGSRDIDSLTRKNRFDTNTMTVGHAPRQNDKVYRAMYGTEAWVFYPGKKGGKLYETQCDDTSKEFCWQKARILNEDLKTSSGRDKSIACNMRDGHCLHVLWRDGGDQFPYTCPSWIRHPFSWVPCKSFGPSWQPCPAKFSLVESGDPGGEVDLARLKAAEKTGKTCKFLEDTHCVWVPGRKLRNPDDEADKALEKVRKENPEDPVTQKEKEEAKLGAPPPKRDDRLTIESEFPKDSVLTAGKEAPMEDENHEDGDRDHDDEAGEGDDGDNDQEDGESASKGSSPRSTSTMRHAPKALVFDVASNEYWQCIDKMRCRKFPVSNILQAGKDDETEKICGPKCTGKDMQCFVPSNSNGSNDQPLCVDKTGIRVVIPYDRTGLKVHSKAQPIKPGMLLNDAATFL